MFEILVKKRTIQNRLYVIFLNMLNESIFFSPENRIFGAYYQTNIILLKKIPKN